MIFFLFVSMFLRSPGSGRDDCARRKTNDHRPLGIGQRAIGGYSGNRGDVNDTASQWRVGKARAYGIAPTAREPGPPKVKEMTV